MVGDQNELLVVSQQQSVTYFLADEYLSPMKEQGQALDLELMQSSDNFEPVPINKSSTLVLEPQASISSPVKIRATHDIPELQLTAKASQSTQECTPFYIMSPSILLESSLEKPVDFETAARLH